MQVLALRIELRFPMSRSLKDKRMQVKRIVDGARARFGVSVAETDHLDAWQLCQIGVAIVSASVSVAERVADDVERFVWSHDDLEVLEIERLWLDTA